MSATGVRKGPTFVYFIAPQIGGPIKIGCSDCPALRLISLNAWAPYKLEVLAEARGRWEDEQAIHRAFVAHWSHSEWFRPHPDIYALINEIRATGAIPERFRWVEGNKRGLPRGTRRKWSEEARAKARKTHQRRWDAIKASRAARPEIVAFLGRTGMAAAELDAAAGSGHVVRHTVKSGDAHYGAEYVPTILDFIRAHDAQKESAA